MAHPAAKRRIIPLFVHQTMHRHASKAYRPAKRIWTFMARRFRMRPPDAGRKTQMSVSGELAAEREKGVAGKLEMLLPERDAYDGDAQDKPEDNMHHGYLPPPEDNPDQIEE